MKKLTYFLPLLVLSSALPSLAREFETFDGQYYNGQFYPLIDIIEWGEQDGELPHLEFHVHQKEKPVDLAVVAGKKGGRPVLWIMYDLAYRGERVCRHVLAPAHFKEGQQLYLYRDNKDADYDNIYVYAQPLKQKGKTQIPEYQAKTYERCSDANASNMPEAPGAKPVAGATPAAPAASGMLPRGPASDAKGEAPAPAKGKGLPVDYDNTAVPFSF